MYSHHLCCWNLHPTPPGGSSQPSLPI